MNKDFTSSVKVSKGVEITEKAMNLLRTEVQLLRENGQCASNKSVVSNCIYQVLGKKAEGAV
ncbi:MAG: hypothetical protein LBC64_08135 [Fibromonadaceae bacterium]|jgi:hypothetical protein|nr:hypothetical protein [Fibromonadaceae bacterium]